MKTSPKTQDQAAAAPDAPGSRLPLFYREPRPVSSVEHAAWRLKAGDHAFAASTAYVPIVVGEMAAASRSYPIVFAGDEASPLALTGLERDNLFVRDGGWDPDAYVPAYVRRYPFGFLATRDPNGFVLGLDMASDRVVREGDEGEPLFEDGKPAPILRDALWFCDAFQGEADATRAFSEALKARNLLVERRADATLPDGRKLALEGFRIIDAEAFQALPDDAILDWHRNGWLALAHFHLASLDRFSSLLARRQARTV